MNSDRQGLQIFASGTGRIIRSLVSDKSASLPQVSGDSVYYAGGLRHRWRSIGQAEVQLVVVQQNRPTRTAGGPLQS